jgi:hypothetical protein
MQIRFHSVLWLAMFTAFATPACIRPLTPVLDGFRSAAENPQSIRVYEGLPHQSYEGELLEQERNTKAVRELHGFPFYRESLVVEKQDAVQLATILADSTVWTEFSGEKKCGGFHPDYAIEVARGGETYVALLCFGCGEGKIYQGSVEGRYDMNLKPKLVLDKYQVNRPQSDARP